MLIIINLKRESESFLKVEQNNDIRTTYVQVNIDKTQRNRRWRLYGDKDEIINQIISKSHKLVQREYKTTHDRMWKVIHCQYDHTNRIRSRKWDAQNSQAFRDKNARQQDLIFVNNNNNNNNKKTTCKAVDFAHPENHKVKLIESEKRDK